MNRNQPPLKLTERGEWVKETLTGILALIVIPFSIVPLVLWLGGGR